MAEPNALSVQKPGGTSAAVEADGTNAQTFTVNKNAVSTVDEDATLYILSADGTAATNDDLVRLGITVDGDNEEAVLAIARSRNGAAYSEVATEVHLGTPAQVAAIAPALVFNGATGGAPKQSTITGTTDGHLTYDVASGQDHIFSIGAAEKVRIGTRAAFSVQLGPSEATGCLELNGSGQTAVLGAGTAALPALITAANDTDTGYLSGGANIMGRTTGGVEEYFRNRTLQTTDATVTAIDTIALSDETVYQIETTVIARDQAATSAQRGTWKRYGCFYREAAGGATQEGATIVLGTDIETTASMNVTMTVSSNDVLINVTGIAATTLRWRSFTTVRPVSTT